MKRFDEKDEDKRVVSFLHEDTQTLTHVLIDQASQQCAVIDPVLDYEPRSGRTCTNSADEVIEFIENNRLSIRYIIETHAHADHLSAAPHIKNTLGGQVMIGHQISKVQAVFKKLFNLASSFATDARQFDLLSHEGEAFTLGDLRIEVLSVPGHTPADMAYVVTGNHNTTKVVFVGDTIFAPDVGTARCDFPGGDAGELFRSIERLLSLGDDTKLFLCHDYPPTQDDGRVREHIAHTTVFEEKNHNVHVHTGVSEKDFVTMRRARDKTLNMPRLILPSVQVNIRAGELPKPEGNGVRYLKIPLNQLD